jgi:hypothetical protein
MLVFAISDTAQVLISLGPAVIAGLAGYWGARLQYQGEDQARQTEQRGLRKEAYHRLLDSVLREVRYWSSAEPVTHDDVLEMQRESHTRMTEFYLVGTHKVVDATEAWASISIKVDEQIEELTARRSAEGREGAGVWRRSREEAFKDHKSEIDAGTDALIKAMRDDVGPT